jgi:hypothetical protein
MKPELLQQPIHAHPTLQANKRRIRALGEKIKGKRGKD